MNRVIGDLLRNYSDSDPTQWPDWLPLAEFAINNAKNRSTGMSPFFLNKGYHPRLPTALPAPSGVPAADAKVDTLLSRLKDAKERLKKAQSRQKTDADKLRADAHFSVGDLVLLSTKNLSAMGGARKLMPKFIGPFPIEEKINDVAFRLTLPTQYRFHNVFHVSLLRPYKSDKSAPMPVTPNVDPTSHQPLFTPEKILDHKDKDVRKRRVRSFLVKWEGLDLSSARFVPESDFPPALRHMVDAYEANLRRADAAA